MNYFLERASELRASILKDRAYLHQHPEVGNHLPVTTQYVMTRLKEIGIGGKLILGWINDKYGVTASSIFGCVTFGLAFVFILLSSNGVGFLYAMAIVFGLGNVIGTVSPPLVTAEVFGKEKYSEAYGIAYSFSPVGLSLGSLMVAAMYDMSGDCDLA